MIRLPLAAPAVLALALVGASVAVGQGKPQQQDPCDGPNTVCVGESVFEFDPEADAPVGVCVFKRRPVEGQGGVEALTVDVWVWARQADGFVAVTTVPNVVVDPVAWPGWVESDVDDCDPTTFGEGE